MRLAPGSVLWLLRHEIRLQWRTMGQKMHLGILLGLALVFCHGLAGLIAFGWRHSPPTQPIPPIYGLASLTAVSLVVFLLMLSSGLVAAVKAIYTRGDMTLLLSSPIAPRSIVAVRAAAIAVTLCGGAGALILPFANVFAVFITPKWLLAYVALPCFGALATGVSLMAASGLFRLLGPRRTRVFAQILGALIGVAAVILPQLQNLLSNQAKQAAARDLAALATGAGADSWMWLPARALLGEPLPLLALVLLSFGLFTLATFALADRFIAQAVAAGGVAGGAGKPHGRSRRFRTDTASVLRRKELRLLARDPWLLTQIGQQLIYMVPAAILIWQRNAGPAGWLILVFVAGNLAAALAWLTVSGEDAPDLLASAPLRTPDVLRAKLEAALLPATLALALPIAWAFRTDAWLGLTLLTCSAGSALGGAVLELWFPSQGKRSEFNKRAKGRAIVGLAETLLAVGWTGTAFLMLMHSPWALLPAPLLLALPAAVKLLKKPERTKHEPLNQNVAASACRA